MSSSYGSLDWVLSHWAYFTVHRFICVYVCVFFSYLVILHMCCIIVTQWGGPGGTEAQSLGPSFSALTLLVGHLIRKNLSLI